MYLLIKKCVKDFYKENVHKDNNQKEILLINQGQFETQLFFTLFLNSLADLKPTRNKRSMDPINRHIC